MLALGWAGLLRAQHAPPRGSPATDSEAHAADAARLPVVPIDYFHLPNGLKVVLVRDTLSPVVVVDVHYGIGQRTEPRGHEGFAHLFEHLMFEGSTHLAPGELLRLIQSNGGTLNGNTRFDFTDYFEVVPPSALRLMLWAEADRMGGLVVDEAALHRQKEIVKSEIRVAYLNQPDGGFPWLDVPQVANRNWPNAHNFRGLPGELDAATLADVRAFHDAFYVPNNAVLVVAGNCRPSEVRGWVEQYFGRLPRGRDVALPDVAEPPQTEERYGERVDSLATRPVLAVAFHMPDRGTRAFYAMVLLDQLLLQGHDSWLARELVRQPGLADAVSGGANLQGNIFDYRGPMLWTVAAQYTRPDGSRSIVDRIQAVLNQLQVEPLADRALELARRKAKSSFYDAVEYYGGFGRADLLASYALFDDDPDEINHVEAALDAVTAADVMTTAQTYLSQSSRTVYIRRPPEPGAQR